MVEVPKIKMPKRAKRSKLMKGRPITTEEFEGMLAACKSSSRTTGRRGSGICAGYGCRVFDLKNRWSFRGTLNLPSPWI